MNPVLVLVPPRGAGELLTVARRLGQPIAVVKGPADPSLVAPLGKFGAHQIVFTGNAPDVVEALVDLANRLEPSAVVIAASRAGNEMGGRLAVRLGSGLVTAAVDVRADPDGPIAVTMTDERRIIRGIPVFTLQTAAVMAEPAPAQPQVVELRSTPSPTDGTIQLVSRETLATSTMSTAPIVVAGGHGVGSRDGFALVGQVADALGGEPAGSHTAAELGWCPRQRQVDQIGSIVHPRLYVALGISGSVRHRAGMQRAETIVAINRDPTAPIFQIADFGVVGDLHQVVPELLAELGRRRRQEWCGDS